MTATDTYAIDEFVADAQRILAAANGDRAQVVRELTPLVERIVWNDELLDERYRAEPEFGRARYEHHRADDGSLTVYVVEFAPGMPTPVHDHLAWGLIGLCGGQQRTQRYARLDDGATAGHAELQLLSDEVLSRGAVYPLLPPNDIHRIETAGDTPSYSLHVLGVDLSRQARHTFDVATGKVTDIEGQGM